MTVVSPTAYVYDGREALGHVIARGKLGFEAFGADDASLGVFPSQREAAKRLLPARACGSDNHERKR
jgi:hypothetical protein